MLFLRSSNIHAPLSNCTQTKKPKECDCSIQSPLALQHGSYYHDRSFRQILHDLHQWSSVSTRKEFHAIHFPIPFYTLQAFPSFHYFEKKRYYPVENNTCISNDCLYMYFFFRLTGFRTFLIIPQIFVNDI